MLFDTSDLLDMYLAYRMALVLKGSGQVVGNGNHPKEQTKRKVLANRKIGKRSTGRQVSG